MEQSQPGNSGDGVSSSANLQDACPAAIQGGANDRIYQAAFCSIPFDAVLETQINQLIRHAGRLHMVAAQQHQTQDTSIVKDGKSVTASREGVRGFLRYKGKDLVFVGGGCSVFDDEMAHKHDFQGGALAYVAKYVMKGQEGIEV